jgi:hypothetical protein
MVIDCKHCESFLIAYDFKPSLAQYENAVEVYSQRCFCHLSDDNLRGLLQLEPSAIETRQWQMRRWYEDVIKYSPETAHEIAYLTFHLLDRQRKTILHILEMRELAEQKGLTHV